MTHSTLLRFYRLLCAGHVARMDDSRILPKTKGRSPRRNEASKKAYKKMEGCCRVGVDTAARQREDWRKEIWEAMPRQRAETPQGEEAEEDEDDDDDEKKKKKKRRRRRRKKKKKK